MSNLSLLAEIRIEKAAPGHLVEIMSIINAGAAGVRVGTESSAAEQYRPAFESLREAPEADIYVALDGDGAVVGTYQIHFHKGLAYRGRPRAGLESVHTRSDMRGKGIGRLMMEHAEGLASAADACLLQLTSNKTREDAHRFYERLGYDPSHTGFKKML